MSQAPEVRSSWRPGRPVDLRATLGVLVRGGADPTHRWLADGSLWRVCRTPLGSASLHLAVRSDEMVASAWGPGAAWVVDGVPELLGDADDDSDFEPHHPRVRAAWRSRPGWRVPRTRLVVEALAAAVIEQKVTGQEAFAGYRRLVVRFGEPAPGPAAALGLHVPPDPAGWAAIASWEWLRAGVDGARSRALVGAVRRGPRLEQTLDLPRAAADRRMRALPGIGAWTCAEVRQRAHGDADAVSFGDFHVPGHIGWVLTGGPVDDEGLAELLEPYRPHRYRVQRLLDLEAPRRARRAPRPGPRTHLPVR